MLAGTNAPGRAIHARQVKGKKSDTSSVNIVARLCKKGDRKVSANSFLEGLGA